MIESSYSKLTTEKRSLIDAAIAVCLHSYNPYSGFSVGAALLAASGEVVSGTNIENAAYGSTICAERSALAAATAQGLRSLRTIAITGHDATGPQATIVSPCGACRQMLFEASQVAGCDLEILLAASDRSRVTITSISELLPLGFGPKQLGIDISRYLNGALRT